MLVKELGYYLDRDELDLAIEELDEDGKLMRWYIL